MDELNNLFKKCNISNEDIQNNIKKNLNVIINSYLNHKNIDFSCINNLDNNIHINIEIQFLKDEGISIIIEELKQKNEYININDVHAIIDYYIDLINKENIYYNK